MTPPRERIALFLDMSNLYYAAQALIDAADEFVNLAEQVRLPESSSAP